MTLHELKDVLRESRDELVEFSLPDGTPVPAACHLTEVGHVRKSFIDCGGKRRTSEACVLQLWLGPDTEHRLRADKFLRILELGREVVPSDELPVEIEYEDEIISQFPLSGFRRVGNRLVLELAGKHTDCLAREKCLPAPTSSDDACCSPASSCC